MSAKNEENLILLPNSFPKKAQKKKAFITKCEKVSLRRESQMDRLEKLQSEENPLKTKALLVLLLAMAGMYVFMGNVYLYPKIQESDAKKIRIAKVIFVFLNQ